MPAGMQKVEGQLPGPPAFWSAVLSSKIFWYSGVSGGGPASSRQLFGLPVRTHCPLRSGDFPKSTTWARHGVPTLPAAIAIAQIELRYSMRHSPWDRPIGACRSRTVGAYFDCVTIHRSPGMAEG